MSYRSPIRRAAAAAALIAVAAATVSAAAGLSSGRREAGLRTYVAGVPLRIGPLTPLTRVVHPGQRLRPVPLACGAPLVCPIALYRGAQRVGYLPGGAARAIDRLLAERRKVSVQVVEVDQDDPVRGTRIRVAWSN
ncbi:MAG: hypothetical protein WCC36_01580 [Gammaproteobacteria bacterium]